jgi:hypothetical protein
MFNKETTEQADSYTNQRIIFIMARTIREYLSEGQCENTGNQNIVVCMNGQPEVLSPGDRTAEGRDCDGIIHEDGSGEKIWGRTGIKEHVSKEWVKEHWPSCSKDKVANLFH